MPDTDQLEEIVFEAPAPGPPVVVNPDVFVRKLLAQDRGPTIPTAPHNRIRATVWRKLLLCTDCVVGQHKLCSEPACPCVHHDCRKEKQDAQAEDYCWPV